MTPWRLYLSGPGNGAWNMAVDEALVQSVQAGEPPVLRLYSWDPHTLSLGRFQNAPQDLDQDGLEKQGLPVVRRMTGGGALYHGEDFTYSLACRQSDIGDLSVKESFRKLCSFLVETWRSLGYQAGFAVDLDPDAGDLGVRTPVCFAGREEFDILVKHPGQPLWQKLGGNAQRRLHATIFQHGSVPIRNDWERLRSGLQDHAKPLGEPSTDLRSLGWAGDRKEVDNLYIEHFSRILGVTLVPWEPEEGFLAAAGKLFTEKYTAAAWTFGGREAATGA